MNGTLITIEGGDGAGKSSLIRGLYKEFANQELDIIETKAPGATQSGQIIRKLLLHPVEPIALKGELFLYLADRSDHVEKVISPALKSGKIVLCDRYHDSTIAYQGVGREFGVEWVKKLCSFASGGVFPDLTLYLDIDPQKGLERILKNGGAKDRIEKEDLTFHEKIRQCFLKMAENQPDRICIIDASASPKEVLKQALDCIEDHTTVLKDGSK